MCELFGMSTRKPSTVSLSLEEFSRHGGLSVPHKDGLQDEPTRPCDEVNE